MEKLHKNYMEEIGASTDNMGTFFSFRLEQMMN